MKKIVFVCDACGEEIRGEYVQVSKQVWLCDMENNSREYRGSETKHYHVHTGCYDKMEVMS